MNDTLHTIFTRRSVRSYLENQISDDELELIIQAGLYAPSGMNTQSWHFAVVQNPDMLQRLEDVCSQYKRRDSVFYHAPTVIVVFADKNAVTPIRDGSLAIGNMANAAASLGIGSCWVNAVNNLASTPEGTAVKNELMPDDNYITVGSIVLGYPASDLPDPAERKENTVTFFR